MQILQTCGILVVYLHVEAHWLSSGTMHILCISMVCYFYMVQNASSMLCNAMIYFVKK